MASLEHNPSGVKEITFTGTGPNATKPTTPTVATETPSRKVLLRGEVIKSVVGIEIKNTGNLVFKGKVASCDTKSDAGDKLGGSSSSNELADITVNKNVKMCVVAQSMHTNGICFEGAED